MTLTTMKFYSIYTERSLAHTGEGWCLQANKLDFTDVISCKTDVSCPDDRWQQQLYYNSAGNGALELVSMLFIPLQTV